MTLGERSSPVFTNRGEIPADVVDKADQDAIAHSDPAHPNLLEQSR